MGSVPDFGLSEKFSPKNAKLALGRETHIFGEIPRQIEILSNHILFCRKFASVFRNSVNFLLRQLF